MLSIIVVKAKNNIIVNDNSMLWKSPDDIRKFKDRTSGHTIIMSKKTFEALGDILPDGKNIILSKNPDFNIDSDCVKVVHSLLELQEYMEDDEEHFVIGGAIIYNLLMQYSKKIYVAQLNKDIEGDSLFPKIHEDEWEEISRKKILNSENNNLDCEYITYVKK